MNIYTVELQGKHLDYIGIAREKSRAAAAVRVTLNMMEEFMELAHHVYLREISKHVDLDSAARYCKHLFPWHEFIDPDFTQNKIDLSKY